MVRTYLFVFFVREMNCVKQPTHYFQGHRRYTVVVVVVLLWLPFPAHCTSTNCIVVQLVTQLSHPWGDCCSRLVVVVFGWLACSGRDFILCYCRGVQNDRRSCNNWLLNIKITRRRCFLSQHLRRSPGQDYFRHVFILLLMRQTCPKRYNNKKTI